MGYHRDPVNPHYWCYDGLRIQADVETHQFVVKTARTILRGPAAVLDIAAGDGALAKRLLDEGYQVSCTSWDGKSGANAPVYRLNLDWPFEPQDVGSRLYDLVCAIEIIEHVENPACFLRSCAAVLAPGGHLILSTPNVESAEARLQWLVHGFPRMFSEFEVNHNRHVSMLWRQGLDYQIRQAGLRIIEKHLTGSYRTAHSIGRWPKRLLYALMETILPGDIKGSSRVYVLSR